MRRPQGLNASPFATVTPPASRVAVPSPSSRHNCPVGSCVAVFIDPDSDALVEVLESCTSPDNPARFGPVTAGAHLQSKLEASHKGRFAQ